MEMVKTFSWTPMMYNGLHGHHWPGVNNFVHVGKEEDEMPWKVQPYLRLEIGYHGQFTRWLFK